MKVRVEYEITPIRHIAVQCPECNNWFYGRQITNANLYDIVDVQYAKFICPKCNNSFCANDNNLEVEERNNYLSVYEGALEKKVSRK